MGWVFVLEQLFLAVHEAEQRVGGECREHAAHAHVQRERREVDLTVALQPATCCLTFTITSCTDCTIKYANVYNGHLVWTHRVIDVRAADEDDVRRIANSCGGAADVTEEHLGHQDVLGIQLHHLAQPEVTVKAHDLCLFINIIVLPPPLKRAATSY